MRPSSQLNALFNLIWGIFADQKMKTSSNRFATSCRISSLCRISQEHVISACCLYAMAPAVWPDRLENFEKRISFLVWIKINISGNRARNKVTLTTRTKVPLLSCWRKETNMSTCTETGKQFLRDGSPEGHFCQRNWLLRTTSWNPATTWTIRASKSNQDLCVHSVRLCIISGALVPMCIWFNNSSTWLHKDNNHPAALLHQQAWPPLHLWNCTAYSNRPLIRCSLIDHRLTATEQDISRGTPSNPEWNGGINSTQRIDSERIAFQTPICSTKSLTWFENLINFSFG